MNMAFPNFISLIQRLFVYNLNAQRTSFEINRFVSGCWHLEWNLT